MKNKFYFIKTISHLKILHAPLFILKNIFMLLSPLSKMDADYRIIYKLRGENIQNKIRYR